MTGVLKRRGNVDTDGYREMTVRRHWEKTAICEPKREASEVTNIADNFITDF